MVAPSNLSGHLDLTACFLGTILSWDKLPKVVATMTDLHLPGATELLPDADMATKVKWLLHPPNLWWVLQIMRRSKSIAGGKDMPEAILSAEGLSSAVYFGETIGEKLAATLMTRTSGVSMSSAGLECRERYITSSHLYDSSLTVL